MQSTAATASEPLAAPTSKRLRPASIALWALQILIAVSFVFAGVNKLLVLPPWCLASIPVVLGLIAWARRNRRAA